MRQTTYQLVQDFLHQQYVGGFNPIKKYISQHWIISPIFGVKIKTTFKNHLDEVLPSL